MLDLTDESENKATDRLVHPLVAVKFSPPPPPPPPAPLDSLFFLIISFAILIS